MARVCYRERDCRPLLRRRRENLEMGHYPVFRPLLRDLHRRV